MTRTEHNAQTVALVAAAERDYQRGRFEDAAGQWRIVVRYAECAGNEALAITARVAADTCAALAAIAAPVCYA